MKKKAAPAKRRKAPKASEKETVRLAVEEATGVGFEVVPPHPAFPLPVDRVEWFMRCRNKDEIMKAPYLNVVWKERRAGIWLESLAVGDTVDWIELAYGDEKAGESLDLNYALFEDPAFLAEFKRKFPVVMARIREYELIVEAVSKKRGVRLEVRRAGTKGMLVFTVAASIKPLKSAASTRNAIRKGRLGAQGSLWRHRQACCRLALGDDPVLERPADLV